MSSNAKLSKTRTKLKDGTNDKKRALVATTSATSSSEVADDSTDRPNFPHTHETSNGDANLSDLTVTQSSCEQSDIQSHLNAESRKRGVKQEQKEATSIKVEPQERNRGQVGTKRNLYKNEGTLRQKPGPNPKNETVV